MVSSRKSSVDKKKIRPSPSASATSFSVGTRKEGNDGNMWIIMKASNGVNRWQKESGSRKKESRKKESPSKLKKSYFTHDNGGSPFLVYIGRDTVEIYKNPNYFDTEERNDKNEYTVLVKKYDKIQKIFIGQSPMEPRQPRSSSSGSRKRLKAASRPRKLSGKHDPDFDGNSILLKLKDDRYVFIGERIYEFSTSEPITTYYSLVGNSDVPYPVALSDNYVYFMLGGRDNVLAEYVDRSFFPEDTDWRDAYTQYYQLFPTQRLKEGKVFPVKKTKLIHKRLF